MDGCERLFFHLNQYEYANRTSKIKQNTPPLAAKKWS
jgi:hypothetical protein